MGVSSGVGGNGGDGAAETAVDREEVVPATAAVVEVVATEASVATAVTIVEATRRANFIHVEKEGSHWQVVDRYTVVLSHQICA